MTRERGVEVLEKWRRVASAASRPAVPPRSEEAKTGLGVPFVIVAGVLVVAALLVGRPPSVPSTGALPTTAAATTPAPSMSETPLVASETPAPIASPTATATPTSTISSDDAKSLVQRYEIALATGHYEQAWEILAPDSRARLGTLSTYSQERALFFRDVRDRFEVTTPTSDEKAIANWVSGDPPPAADLTTAYIVQVNYPEAASTNSGFEVFLVARDGVGRVALWWVR